MKTAIIKVSLLIFFAGFITSNLHARCCVRVGHATGTYDRVYEDDPDHPASSVLHCEGGGDTRCAWPDGEDGNVIFINVNGNPVTNEQAGYIVQQNINNNITEGTVHGDNNIGFYSWYFDANNQLIFTFDEGQIN
jgi:hypothetical protein